MRFLTPPQTFAEYKHKKMPVFETLGLSAGSAALIGGALGAAGGIGGALLSKSGGGGGMPSFNPQQALALEQQQYNQMAGQAPQFGQNAYNQASQEGLQFSTQGTQANIANQNLVTPGSSAQRQIAQNQINSYIQGQIPQNVQQQINRQVAQNLGGGFNLFSGGGQAPQNFARNIGQTSLGLSQYGLSAAPTWQQLANQMVVSPAVGLSAGLQATGMGTQLAESAAGLGNQLAESQYQGAFNQYQANQLQNQQQAQLGMQLGQLGLQAYNAGNMANYYNNLSRLNTLGGIPAAQIGNYGLTNSDFTSTGNYQPPI